MFDRFQKMPLWGTGVTVFVVAFAARMGFALAFPARHQDLTEQAISALVYAVFLAVILTVGLARRRRRAGGTAALAAMQRALKTGDTPQDADPRTWTPQFTQWERQLRRARWFGPVFFGVLATLGVFLAFAGDGLGTLSPLLAALFVAVGVWSVVQAHHRLPRVRRVLDTLRQRGQQWTVGDAPATATDAATGVDPAAPAAGARSPH
jgi:hypothetical protein